MNELRFLTALNPNPGPVGFVASVAAILFLLGCDHRRATPAIPAKPNSTMRTRPANEYAYLSHDEQQLLDDLGRRLLSALQQNDAEAFDACWEPLDVVLSRERADFERMKYRTAPVDRMVASLRERLTLEAALRREYFVLLARLLDESTNHQRQEATFHAARARSRNAKLLSDVKILARLPDGRLLEFEVEHAELNVAPCVAVGHVSCLCNFWNGSEDAVSMKFLDGTVEEDARIEALLGEIEATFEN